MNNILTSIEYALLRVASNDGVVRSQSDKHQKSLSLIDLAVTLNCKCVSY